MRSLLTSLAHGRSFSGRAVAGEEKESLLAPPIRPAPNGDAEMNVRKDLGLLIFACLGWFGAGVFFSVAFKYSLTICDDVILLTTLHFGFSAAAFVVLLPCQGGLAPLCNVMLTPKEPNEAAGSEGNDLGTVRWRFPNIKRSLLISSMLFLGGTLMTNVSLSLMPVGIAHILKASEPLFTIMILCVRNHPPGMTTVFACITIVVGVISISG